MFLRFGPDRAGKSRNRMGRSKRGQVVPYLIFGLAILGGCLAIWVGWEMTQAERSDWTDDDGTGVSVQLGTAASVDRDGDSSLLLGVETEPVTIPVSAVSEDIDNPSNWIEVEPPRAAAGSIPLPGTFRVEGKGRFETGEDPEGERKGAGVAIPPVKTGAEAVDADEDVAPAKAAFEAIRALADRLDAENLAPTGYIQGKTLAEAAEKEERDEKVGAAVYLYGRAADLMGGAVFDAAIAGLRSDVAATGIPPEVVAASPVWKEVLGNVRVARENLEAGSVEDAVAVIFLARKRVNDVRIQILDTKRAEAAATVSRGEVAAGREIYRQILDWSPDDAEAKAFIERNRFRAGERWENTIGMGFVYVPGGRFLRGSPASEPERDLDEGRSEVVIADGFFIGIGEVTQAEWVGVMGALPSAVESGGEIWRGDGLPIHSVTWDEAMAFCAALSEREGRVYRLPTETEWEYAARAGSGAAFVNGMDQLVRGEAVLAFSDGRRPKGPSSVAEGEGVLVNALGLVHVHGNLWEWTADIYGPYREGEAADDLLAGMKVVRGGSFIDRPQSARLANRWARPAETASPYIGFRVVVEVW